MQSKIGNWHNCISDILNMRSREEWKNKFQENKKQIIEVFAKLHNLSEENIFDAIVKHGEYMGSQLAGVYIETFLSRYFEDGSNVVDAYINRFKHRLPKNKIKVYEEFRNAYFSVYKIVNVRENEYSIVQDTLFDTNEIKVVEHSGSKREMIGQYVLADVLEFDGEYFFSGIVLPLVENRIDEMTYELKKEIRKLKLSYKDKNLVPIEEIRTLVYKHYPTLFYHALAPYIIKPKIINPNGDEFSPKICKFKIKPENKEKIREILNNLNNYKDWQIHNTAKDSWAVRILRKSSQKIKKSELGINDFIPYADIVMENDCLKILAIYSNELDRIITILRQKLKDLIGLAVLEDLNPDDLELFQEDNKSDIKDEIPQEQLKEIMKAFWDKHLKETLKVKIPILNNLTPKQCLKKDPETFYKWLKSFIDNIKTQSDGIYDYHWFLDELGIKEPK